MPIPPAVPLSPGLWFVPEDVPLLPRLMLEPLMSRAGMFDGAWWPRSNDIRAELPDLITALGAHLGRIVRVGLATTAWTDIPRRFTVNGLVVRVGRFSGSDETISLTRGFQDHFLLLVVPPGTDPHTAAVAMAGAAAARNHSSATELLG